MRGGWSEENAGPGGLAALIVATFRLPSMYYLRIRDSFRIALKDMRADPEWKNIRSPQDADRLVDKYL